MRNARVNTSFTGYTDGDLEIKARLIFKSLTNNPAFTDPIPNLADLLVAVEAFSVSLVGAAELGRVNVSNKDARREQLEQLLRQLAMYVMFIANGDEQILMSTGFTVTKIASPRYIGTTSNVTLSNGITSGQMISAVKKSDGAYGYLHEICTEQPTDATVWTSYPTTRCKFTFTNLVPGKQYWVRVAVIGAGAQIAYSTVATQFAQ